jgi:putative Mn2+ efflux pump MntP
MQLISILLIGIALSMDTFSLSLGIGTFSISNKKALQLSLMVGIMHFCMPYIGMNIGNKLIDAFELKCDILLGIVLIFIAIEMLIDIIKHEENKFQLSFLGMFLFALGVSIDSFSIGLGMKAITDNIYLAMSIFAICSFSFTYVGILIGKYASKILGNFASVIGAIILIVLGIMHLV